VYGPENTRVVGEQLVTPIWKATSDQFVSTKIDIPLGIRFHPVGHPFISEIHDGLGHLFVSL
jgi:hypothetical protein